MLTRNDTISTKIEPEKKITGLVLKNCDEKIYIFVDEKVKQIMRHKNNMRIWARNVV